MSRSFSRDFESRSFNFSGIAGFKLSYGNWRPPIQDRLEDHAIAASRKRDFSGRHFVHHVPNENRSVRRIEFFRPELFRRHIRDGSNRRPGLVIGHSGVVIVCSVLWASLANPKSSTLAWPRSVMKIFAGLMSRCMMPLHMRGIERVRHLDALCEQRFHIHRAPADSVLQCLAARDIPSRCTHFLRVRRFREWCKCSDGSAMTRLALRGEIGSSAWGSLEAFFRKEFQRDEPP